MELPRWVKILTIVITLYAIFNIAWVTTKWVRSGIKAAELKVIREKELIKTQKKLLEAADMQIVLIERQMNLFRDISFETIVNKRNLALISSALQKRQKILSKYLDRVKRKTSYKIKSRKKTPKKHRRKRRK